MKRAVTVKAESWPLKTVFNISRGAKRAADVVVVEIKGDGVSGLGECVPYARYGESQTQVIEDIQTILPDLEGDISRQDLQGLMPAGAARNAVDCALWQHEARKKGTSLAGLFGLKEFCPIRTAQTISLDTPDKMAAAARDIGNGLIKIKLDGTQITQTIQAVREAAPEAKIIIDANEAWSMSQLANIMPTLVELRIDLIEQPLPQSQDSELEFFDSPIPICADESCHTSDNLEILATRYDVVNIKLDKTGGLTEALKLRASAERLGLDVMLGCMVCTSLSIAPIFALSQGIEFIDVDGPLWLAQDRPGGCVFDGHLMHPPAIMSL